ncbi:MAG: MFS transporter [Oscillospiraceae bacterium]|nr:MFS transporter [Oscillospiraceae bacterium]
MSAAVKAKSGLLANAFKSSRWNSRITTANVSSKELWLGYVIGPYGMLVVQSIVNSYYNQYMTDVLGFTAERALWMASFMVLFPLLSKLFDAVTNIVMSKVIDSTVCRQGKVRPWLILSIPLVVLSVVLLFWIPFSGPRAQAAWVCFSYVLYYCVSFTMWNMSKELTPALSTRNVAQRKNLATAAEITRNVGTGLVSILFPMILSAVCAAMNGNDAQGYLLSMSLMSCLAIPLTFIQYFFTRERVTEERRYGAGLNDEAARLEAEHTLVKPEATLREQLSKCIRDKYWIIFVITVFCFNILSNMRNISLIYYCGWVVRGNQYGARAAIQASFQMIALSPMGPGILLVLPMVKKLGRTRTIWMGSILTVIGSVFAYVMAGNRMNIMIGTAMAAIGNIAFSYLIMSYMGDVIDHVEWKSGTRCDGLTGGFVSAAMMFAVGIAQGLFNLGLMVSRYAQPAEIGVSAEGVKLYADQTAAATGWINFAYQGTYIVMGIMIFVVFKFLFDLEKKMPTVSAELQDRRVAEYAAQGLEYIPPAELERREIEAQKAETESARVADLKALCEKKGLDFETENQKYLDKVAAKQAKADAKAARKAGKNRK